MIPAPVERITVYVCATCSTTEQSLYQLRWHQEKGHKAETLRLVHRSRGRGRATQTQWSSDWESV